MKKLRGKKIACFLALPHHTRFFITLREEIKKQGGELIFIVTLSSYPYELDLIRRKISFRFYTDYLTDTVREKINASTLSLVDSWAKTCFKWDGFSRWPLFKQSWFFEGVIEEYFCMERFIDVEKPDMFIAHHECNRWGPVIGHLCHEKKIPFVTFQEGDYYNDYMGFILHTQYSVADLLWGEKTRKRLRDYHCASDKMFLIGNTHIENAIKTYNTPKAISEIRKELKIPNDKKMVLFLVDIKYGAITSAELWKEILRGLDRLEAEAVLVFKWHPSVMKSTYDDILAVFEALYPSAILLYDSDPYKLIAASDYCVTLGKTTLAIEAIAFGKPLFALPAVDSGEEYYVNMGIAQTVNPPGNWSNLFHTMKAGLPEALEKTVERVLIEYFYKLDGQSVERAVDRMSYILHVKKEGGQMKQKKKETKDHAVKPGRVSFIIPSGSETTTLVATLSSLAEHVNYTDWEVIVVVHHDEINEILPGLSGDIHIVSARGETLASLYNQGLAAARGEYLIFMTPGTLFLKGDGILDGLENGIAGVPIKDAEMAPYCLGIGFDFNFSPYKITDESKQAEAVGGGLIAMKRDLFDELSGFDEEIANHLIETDLCLKGKEKGMDIRYLKDDLAVKYKETFYGEDLSEENWKNRVRFFAKWLGKLPKDEDIVSFSKDLLKI